MVVLITGANGQLGQSLKHVASNYQEIQYIFCDSKSLDITNLENCKSIFYHYKPQYCINAAAYTAVDRAESEPQKAHLINAIGAQNLAVVCKKYHTVLFHVSTDFVFDGEKNTPYGENDIPNPTGVYGQTKLDGENAIQAVFDEYFILRTSWVYSQFGSNFMKTMLRLASERDSLSIVNDQVGTPTNALDLANALLKMIDFQHKHSSKERYGIYNFSNEGQCSWFEFAQKIFEINTIQIDLEPIPTSSYPTSAKRPVYSVLDKTKIKNTFGLEIKNWEDSLKTITI